MLSLPLNIERSIVIEKSIDEVFNVVADFNTWRTWSPWLCQEPDCPVNIEGDAGQAGHTQRWDGQRIGSGEMAVSSVNPPHRIEYQLTFLKPWKSRNKVAFDLAAHNNGTKLTWYMRGTTPVFLFYMRKMMSALVGSDYERGLSMLKEYVETGEVPSHIDIPGEIAAEEFYYVGKRRSCGLNEVGPAMEVDFSALKSAVEKGDLRSGDFAVSFYHKYDMVNKQCEYTSGFGYNTLATARTDNVISGHVEQHQALRVDHKGPYRHLGNAWTAAQGLLRYSKKKPSKTVPMYEIYGNFPGEVEDKDTLTKIHIPLR
jgi:uncharacterized protein YndB with AHSA1/START domain